MHEQHNHNKDNNNHNHKYHSFLQWFALVICSLTLIAVLALIFKDVAGLHRQGYIHRYRRQASVSTLPAIRSWMTFSFINQQYKLPPDYLKTKLNISSKKYPNISISSWASSQKKDSAIVLDEVNRVIKEYLSQPK
jgi:hypothetical protein